DRREDLLVCSNQIIAGFVVCLNVADSGLELFFVENLTTGGTWFQNKKLSVLSSDVQFSVGEHRRRSLQSSDCMFPKLFAGRCVEGKHIGAVIHQIQSISIDDW